MDGTSMGGIINSLPIEKMVSAPLMAAIKAQTDLSYALADYVTNVGLDEDGGVRMVTFNYSENVQYPGGRLITEERHIEAPFLALAGIPNLAIENVDVSFDLEVTAAEETKTAASAEAALDVQAAWSPFSAKFAGKLSHSSDQTRATDTRAKYSFNITAKKQGPPEALMRIIETITNSAANPQPSKKGSNLLEKIPEKPTA